MKLPSIWSERFAEVINSSLKHEAARLFRIHQLPHDAEDWLKLRPILREKIWQSVGLRYTPGEELDCHETASIVMDGYTIKNIYFRSRENFYVTGNLYIPDGEGPFPGVLNVHGHWAQGRLAERIQCRGHTLARNGYVCLAVDAFGAGERSTHHGQFEYHGEMLGASLFNIGESLMGIHLVDNMRAVELLSSLDYVIPDKLGVTGASGGGNQTMWLAAMDDRIKASVPVASVGTFESYIGGSNCVCETLPDGLTFMEESAVLALAAPNAVKICSCLGDIYHAFFPKEMLRSAKEARKVFQALGVDEKLSWQIFNHPHGYWPEMREAMLGWFDQHLRGVGHGAPKAEKPFHCLPEKDLMVFPTGKRDPRVVSISEYCRTRAQCLSTQIPDISPKEKILQLTDLLKLAEPLRLKKLHRYPSDNNTWQRLAAETTCGRMLPLLVRPPVGNKNYVLLAGPTGKDCLPVTEIFQTTFVSREGLVLIDLWGSGETEILDESCDSVYHDLSRSCLWLGKTLLGEWVRDYHLALEILQKEFIADQITLSGHKEAGLSALFAVALLPEKYPVILEDCPLSFAFHQQKSRSNPRTSFYSMALHLPGILKWGDVSLAETLAEDVRWISPRYSDGQHYE